MTEPIATLGFVEEMPCLYYFSVCEPDCFITALRTLLKFKSEDFGIIAAGKHSQGWYCLSDMGNFFGDVEDSPRIFRTVKEACEAIAYLQALPSKVEYRLMFWVRPECGRSVPVKAIIKHGIEIPSVEESERRRAEFSAIRERLL